MLVDFDEIVIFILCNICNIDCYMVKSKYYSFPYPNSCLASMNNKNTENNENFTYISL